MRSRKIASAQKYKSTIKREREPLSKKYFAFTVICGLLLVLGFFGAARQHFASISFGINNAKLKKEVESLKSEQRRLQLNREVALSPSEIKKSARKIGFKEMTASNIQAFRAENISVSNSTGSEKERITEVSLNRANDQPVNVRERLKSDGPKNAIVETGKSDTADDKSKKS